jgi:hypothetical protein
MVLGWPITDDSTVSRKRECNGQRVIGWPITVYRLSEGLPRVIMAQCVYLWNRQVTRIQERANKTFFPTVSITFRFPSDSRFTVIGHPNTISPLHSRFLLTVESSVIGHPNTISPLHSGWKPECNGYGREKRLVCSLLYPCHLPIPQIYTLCHYNSRQYKALSTGQPQCRIFNLVNLFWSRMSKAYWLFDV